MLLADHVPFTDWAGQAGCLLLIFILGLFLGGLVMRGLAQRMLEADSHLLRSCVQRIEPKSIGNGSRYRVCGVLSPLDGNPEALVVLILESFVHMGDRTPELLLELELRPDTRDLLRHKLGNGKPIYMEWLSGRPTFPSFE